MAGVRAHHRRLFRALRRAIRAELPHPANTHPLHELWGHTQSRDLGLPAPDLHQQRLGGIHGLWRLHLGLHARLGVLRQKRPLLPYSK